MKTVTIDFSGAEHIGEVRLILKVVLDFPEWYGENLDALWDLLTGYIEPCIIDLKGTKAVSKELLSYVKEIVDIFFEAEATYGQIKIRDVG